MNHGGTPDASSEPIIAPADVPTTRSALAGSQPVSVASACSPPVSQAPPMTPPAPSTRPTFMLLRPRSYPCPSLGSRTPRGGGLNRRSVLVVLVGVPVVVLEALEVGIVELDVVGGSLVRALDLELVGGRDVLWIVLDHLQYLRF